MNKSYSLHYNNKNNILNSLDRNNLLVPYVQIMNISNAFFISTNKETNT